MRTALLLACGCGIGVPIAVHADGSLPPLPYRYVNPPAALAADNLRPLPGRLLERLSSGSSGALLQFTADGQAGLSAPAGTLRTESTARAIRLLILPIAPPATLPDHLVADGNAYRFSASSVPGNRAVLVVHAVQITMRWPHPPLAMYVLLAEHWSRICSTAQAIITASTMTCMSPVLGTIVTATAASNAQVSYPSTPSPWLSRYLPILSAATLVLLTAGLLYWVTRPDSPRPPEPKT